MPSAKKTTEQNSFTLKEITQLKEDLKHFGYLLPTNDEELDKFEQIYGSTEVILPEYLNDPEFLFSTKSIKKAKEENKTLFSIPSFNQISARNDYFKKIVLAAEIAYELHNEPTFGHIKFVKLLYLCQEVCNMKLSTHYRKYAAGPLDPKLMYSIDNEFKRQCWFKVEKREGYGIKYVALLKVKEYKKYYLNYYSKESEQIGRIINLFRKEKSDFCEAIATLYAVWKEFIESGTTIDDKLLIDRFYAWSEAKSNFEVQFLKNALSWMRTNDIVPE